MHAILGFVVASLGSGPRIDGGEEKMIVTHAYGSPEAHPEQLPMHTLAFLRLRHPPRRARISVPLRNLREHILQPVAHRA